MFNITIKIQEAILNMEGVNLKQNKQYIKITSSFNSVGISLCNDSG